MSGSAPESDIHGLTAVELVRRYRRHELSPVEVVRDVLARIERFNPLVNAFLLVDADGALAAARAAETRWARHEPMGLVDGVPATVKDNIWAKGWPTRKGSATTDLSPAPSDSPALTRLREQGAVILGKTTLPEHGWIGVCHSPLTGITRNPWNLGRTPGGSTGGGAAAALLNLGSFHLGTDGAGSLRIPAAFTGVFGFKPSFGRVPAYPASAMTVLSHQGPVTRTVADAALMLTIISAPDQRDLAAWNDPAPDFQAALDDGVRGLKIAWSPRLGYVQKLHPEVEAATAKAAQVFEELGAQVEAVDPGFAEPIDMIRTMWSAVATTIVDAVPAHDRAKMDPGFLRVAEQGRRYTLADYLAAYQNRAELANAMARFLERYDLLLTPQMPIPAFAVGHVRPPDGSFGDEWIGWSPYTYPFNLTQQPAASVPCGFSSDGLPIALQIVGPRRGDHLVLRAAYAFEAARPFPNLSEPRGIVAGISSAGCSHFS
jgi:aspartyl-tRNA(Asn)/glutamyl-tRNA(Gln) amidotransferase subunit A